MTRHLYVATNGLSVWSSSDLGETISRMPSSTGMYSGSQVWSLAVHPSDPGVLLAGTDSQHRHEGLSRGRLRSRCGQAEAGALFEHPIDDVCVIRI